MSSSLSMSQVNQQANRMMESLEQSKELLCQQRSISHYKSLSKALDSKELKENYATLSHKEGTKGCNIGHNARKRVSIAHLPAM